MTSSPIGSHILAMLIGRRIRCLSFYTCSSVICLHVYLLMGLILLPPSLDFCFHEISSISTKIVNSSFKSFLQILSRFPSSSLKSWPFTLAMMDFIFYWTFKTLLVPFLQLSFECLDLPRPTETSISSFQPMFWNVDGLFLNVNLPHSNVIGTWSEITLSSATWENSGKYSSQSWEIKNLFNLHMEGGSWNFNQVNWASRNGGSIKP